MESKQTNALTKRKTDLKITIAGPSYARNCSTLLLEANDSITAKNQYLDLKNNA